MSKQPKPSSFSKIAEATHKELTPEQTQEAFNRTPAGPTNPSGELAEKLGLSDPDEEPELDQPGKPRKDIPDWVIEPEGILYPRNGKPVAFLRIRAEMTDTPDKGERQCIVWANTVGDERLARQAQRGDDKRYVEEHAKRMVRAIDGHVVDWTRRNRDADIEIWWVEIGPRGRNLLCTYWMQTHKPSDAEIVDFFKDCVSVLTSR